MKRMKQKGFTLIELLVVIAIIGLLSTMAVIALNSARAKSRDARRLSDIKQMQSALEMYYNDSNAYPTTISSGISTYMTTIPTDPQGATYTYTGNATTYSLQYRLEGTAGGISAGLHTATPAGIQ